ncbi:hypothetical protein ASZ90_016383 [hydrocarbon metagenome]|uniref:Uncharacterized protein n=1 Tax=hydrocarbon metagenome TaxID=938273 RepID=A0A0W8EXS3_9ZZZZ
MPGDRGLRGLCSCRQPAQRRRENITRMRRDRFLFMGYWIYLYHFFLCDPFSSDTRPALARPAGQLQATIGKVRGEDRLTTFSVHTKGQIPFGKADVMGIRESLE